MVIRGYPKFFEINEKFKLDINENTVIVSVVTVGEIYSMAKANKWGEQKLKKLEDLLNAIVIYNIDNSDTGLIKAYMDIDNYSQNKDTSRKLPVGKSSRKMGKNDLWIAATAYVLDAPLITEDKDFDNLNGSFLTVHFIPK